MSETFFISDLHFGHRGILKYEPKRAHFTDVEEMNEYLIQEWNKVVSDADKVFVVGDFAWGSQQIILAKRLKGRKKLVMGNHDNYPIQRYVDAGFVSLHGAVQFENCIITHIPVHEQQLMTRFWCNIHGHLHGQTLEDQGYIQKPRLRYVNVSCEQLPNMAPIPYEEVINRATEISTL